MLDAAQRTAGDAALPRRRPLAKITRRRNERARFRRANGFRRRLAAMRAQARSITQLRFAHLNYVGDQEKRRDRWASSATAQTVLQHRQLFLDALALSPCGSDALVTVDLQFHSGISSVW